jgi:hypothetical protein
MSVGPGAALTVQLLEWVGERPRSYPETLEAWKSSCPRLTIWEDAVTDGLVRIARGHVELTPAGDRRMGEAAGGTSKVASRSGEEIARKLRQSGEQHA